MTSVTQRIKGFLNSPQARRIMQSGRRQAAKPSTQQKLRQMARRIMRRSSSRR